MSAPFALFDPEFTGGFGGFLVACGVFRDMCRGSWFPGPGIPGGAFTLGSIDFVGNVFAIIGRSVVFLGHLCLYYG